MSHGDRGIQEQHYRAHIQKVNAIVIFSEPSEVTSFKT